MSRKPRVISDAVLNKQREASDPGVHAWVSANAGSGKTHVLAQRVIRLLLGGVSPARILCITFTKAAAGNMANRVFDELRTWTALDDGALANAMRNVGARDTSPAAMARARRLFALALETPGGLKVQTIHAFCTHILHLFPFEANVPARFTVLDELEETRLRERMVNTVLLDAAAKPGTPLGDALDYVISVAADSTLRERINDAINERDALEAWLKSAGGLDGARMQLSRALNVEPGDSEQAIAASFIADSEIKPSEWAGIAAIATAGSKTDREQGARFAAMTSLRGAAQIEKYIDVFCTRDRDKTRASIVTNTIKRKHPELSERLDRERERVWALVQKRRGVIARERTIALATIAKAALDLFRAEKARRGLLDFDDQIDKTQALLSAMPSSWVHYKLDQGIHHVLIDEAQDTSEKQWDIIRNLTDEFFAGAGASERPRTIFVVGDDKQSIFSFQGAAPRHFETMRLEFERLSGHAGQTFRHLHFETSLRSGANVLSAVDTVFEAGELAGSLTSDPAGIPEHLPLESAAPGEVEIWETERPEESNSVNDPWDAPFDKVTGSDPAVRLAERIAASIRDMRAAGRRAGDVLILVNRRGKIFETVIRALKNAGIPVAGADRMVLTEHIAVMDLMALADALLLPHDDLALATVLKSPLFGLDEDDIFALAHGRGDISLRTSLEQKAAGNETFAAALQLLHALAERARAATPFAFYAALLGPDKARERILSRLGDEAADPLNEFLNLALDYERSETPSLQGFLDWLRAAQAQVKRDMEAVHDEVRVMTVHGAKGLEAPVVFLADTVTKPEGYHPPALITLSKQTAAPPLVWAVAKAQDVGEMGVARQRADDESRDEHRRLLYVAMTRAAEKLIVCGVDNKNKRPDGCWYDMVFNGLRDKPGFAEDSEGERTIWRFHKVAPGEPEAPEPVTPPPPVDLPPWLTQPVALAPRISALTPSTAIDDLAAPSNGAAARQARERGILIHRLLQSLPDIASGIRLPSALAFLSRAGDSFSDEERAQMAAHAIRILDDARFVSLFAPGSRAEVVLAGTIAQGDNVRSVSGQVDRLAVTATEVLIADFKTNRPAPQRIEDVPPAYLRQLALYRSVLAKIYPGKTVRTALIWTEIPDLMEISSEVLDDALLQFTSA